MIAEDNEEAYRRLNELELVGRSEVKRAAAEIGRCGVSDDR